MLKLSGTFRKLALGTALAGVVGAAGLALSAAPVAAQMHPGSGFHGGGFHSASRPTNGFRGDREGFRDRFREGGFRPGWRGGWWHGRWYGPGWGGWGIGFYGYPYGGYPGYYPYGCSYYDYYYGYCDY
ncbi:MAG TPA: hypothetical protein VGI20_08980 [Rhizomicrobium sp.]